MPNTKQSYQAFLQENLTDRTKQRAYFDKIRETDTRFQGLDEKTSANILADVSGFEPFRRFAQGGVSQALDAFGQFTQNAATDFRPADLGRVPQGLGQLMSGGSEQTRSSPGMEKPVSAYTGDVGYAGAKAFGAGEDTAQAFRSGAEQVPNVLAQTGSMVAGTALAPFTGGASLAAIPAGFASMYGQGLDAAAQKGEFGVRAHASASVGPLVSLATMGLARPLGNVAANAVMKFGTSEAIKDGMKLGGEAGLKSILAGQSTAAGTKFAMKLGQEALVETAQAGIGVVGDVTQNAILDPQTFFNETIKSKDYWIPMLMSEVIEGAGGTVLGRMRKPLEEAPERVAATVPTAEVDPAKLAAVEAELAPVMEGEAKLEAIVKTPEEVEAEEAAQLELPLYNAAAKVENDVDPTSPDSDHKLVEAVTAETQVASGVMATTIQGAKTAKVNPEFNSAEPPSETNIPILPAEETSYVRDSTKIVDIIARGIATKGNVTLHENLAQAAEETVTAAVKNAPAGVSPDQAIANAMENMGSIAGKEFKDHHIETDPGNYIALRNPGTKEHGVLLHFVRGGQVMNKGEEGVSASKLILRPQDLLSLDPVNGRAALDARSKMSEPMSDTEWNTISALSARTKQQFEATPLGVSFGEGHDPVYAQGMTDFLNRSGIQTALVGAGIRMRIGTEAYKTSKATLESNPLDYFASLDRAANDRSFPGLHYISRNRGFGKETDLHEIGHTVGELISRGAFGEEVAVQWVEFIKRASSFEDDGQIGREGAKLGLKATGGKVDDGTVDELRQYYLKAQEIEAQTFQGYMLDVVKGRDGKRNNFYAWVSKTFPELHKLFQKMLGQLNYAGDADRTTNNLNLYSPLYQEGRQLIAGILNAQYRGTQESATRLKKLVGKYSLSGKAVDAVTSAWYADLSPGNHASLSEAVGLWKQGLYDAKAPTEGEAMDLVDTMAQLTHYNRSNVNGHAPAGEAVWGMPWLRKLAGGNLEQIHLAIKGKMQDPTLLNKLNEVFLTKEELEFMKTNLSNISDPTAMKRAATLNRNRELLRLNAQNVTAAIDELLAIQGEHRVAGSQVVKQMFQIDNVVKDWMLGKLPGQEGVPFSDTNTKLFAKELTPSTMKKTGQAHAFHRWFPILSKEIKKRVTKTKLTQMTTVSDDGSIEFGRTGGNRKRKAFTNEVDAADYIAEISRNAQNSSYRFKIKPETKTGKFHITAEKVERDTRYVEELSDMDGWEADMRELVRPAKQIGDETMTMEEKMIYVEGGRRNAVVEEHGPEVVRKLKDTIPTSIKHLSNTGQLNEGITTHENKFTAWLKESNANQKQLADFAHSLGIKRNSKPIDVVTAWLKLHLDEGKSQQKREAIEHLNWLSPRVEGVPSLLNDYISSMTNFAKRYTKARIAESLSDISRSDINGHVPTVSPSEAGGEARLANHDILNNPDVVSGTAAAVNVSTGLQGRKATLEQTAGILRSMMGRPLGVIQKVHGLFGTGPIHHALANPEAEPLSLAIFSEVRNSTAWVQEAFSSLFGEGKFIDDMDGNLKFIPDPADRTDKKSELYQIKENAQLFMEHQEIILLEQKAYKKFGDILKSTDLELVDEKGQPSRGDEIIAQAHEILKNISGENLKIHQRALARRYAAQEIRVRREAEMDIHNQIATFALAISKHDTMEQNASKAFDFASRFNDSTIEKKVLSLVNELNMSLPDAQDTAEKYVKTEDALKVKHQMYYAHPEYVTESRMRDFHVGVVFKKGKDGIVPAPGYYDFDTAAEAYAFIEQQQKLGNKVPKAPKDFARQRWNYKPISGSMSEILERVANERRDLVGTILYKQIKQEDYDLIIRTMSNLATDVANENDVVLATANDRVRRKFVSGRENLDMIDQFKKSTQRRASAISRKRTDLIFKLYENDAPLLKDKALFNIMDSFKTGVRLKDTDAQKMIGQAGFVAYIMGNVSSALVEIFQFPMTLSPILLENGASVFDSYRIPARMMKHATKAAFKRLAQKSDDDIWEGPHLELIRENERQGGGNQRKHHDLTNGKIERMADQYDSATDEHGVKKSALHLGGLTYQFLNDIYGFFNRINAELSLVSSYEVLKKTQYGNRTDLTEMEIKALQTKAMLVSDTANGSLQRLGRPSFMHSDREGWRNASSMYWSLQSFVNAQVANQLRFMQKSINVDGKFSKSESVQARKAMVGLLGAQFTGMGIMGFTLMPAMAKIVQQTFGFDLEDELRDLLYDDSKQTVSEKTFMGEVAVNGLAAAMGAPLDVQTRISVGGIGPMSGFNGLDANQLGGPLIGLAVNAFKDLQKVRAGNMDISEGAVNLLPMGLRRGVRMSFFDDGSVYDANKRHMFQASGVEKVGAWLGFNTLRQKQEMKARMERDEATKGDSGRKSKIANQVIDAQREGNMSRVQQLLMQGAAEFNIKPYDFAQYTASKQVDKKLGPNPREGVGPESIRAKKLYPSPLGNDSAEERLTGIEDAMRGIGIKPHVSRTAHANARQKDYMMKLNPSMTTGMAGRLSREKPGRQGFSQLLGEFD